MQVRTDGTRDESAGMAFFRLAGWLLPICAPFVWIAVLAFVWMIANNIDCAPYSGDAAECLSQTSQLLPETGVLLVGVAYTAITIFCIRKLRKLKDMPE